MINNQNIINQIGKILGFSDDYIKKLNEDYNQASYDGKYEMLDILWKNFFELYNKLTELKYSKMLSEVAMGKRSLDSNLYQQAQDEVKMYFKKVLTGEVEDEWKIQELRQKIMALVGNLQS